MEKLQINQFVIWQLWFLRVMRFVEVVGLAFGLINHMNPLIRQTRPSKPWRSRIMVQTVCNS